MISSIRSRLTDHVLALRVVVLTGVLAAVFASSGAHAAKYAVVDMQRAVQEVDDGAAAKKRLAAEIKRGQAELDTLKNEVQAMKDDFDGQAMMMTDEVKQKRQAEMQQKVMEVQQKFMMMQQGLAKKEQEAMAGILQKMGVVLEQMAKEGGYDLVLDRSTSVLYAKQHLDVTNELIRRYNRAYSKKKSKKSK